MFFQLGVENHTIYQPNGSHRLHRWLVSFPYQTDRRRLTDRDRGKAGRHVIPYLISQGHEILNLDLIDFPDKSVPVYTLKCNLTDSGQVFNALTTLFNMGEYGKEDDWRDRKNGGYLGSPSMVVHFAAYARVSTSCRITSMTFT